MTCWHLRRVVSFVEELLVVVVVERDEARVADAVLEEERARF